jgi:hypothetical protein
MSTIETTIEKLPQIITGIPNAYNNIAVSTLNGVAFHVIQGLKQELATKIDRPKPYTLNAFYYIKATPDNQKAIITTRDNTKGTKPNKYLFPLLYGTRRNAKGYELQFRRAGILPSNAFYQPTDEFPLDAYGNPKPQELVKILSQVKAFSQDGYTANASDSKKSKKKRKNSAYFPQFTKDNDLAPTIFKRDKGGIVPVLFPTTNNKPYKKIIDFEGTVSKEYDNNIEKEYNRAVQKYGILPKI